MKTSFFVYMTGYALVIIAVYLGLSAIEAVGQTATLVVVLMLVGLGIIYAYSRAQDDTARRDQARGTQGGGGAQGNPSHQGGGQQGNTQQGGAQQGTTQQGGGPQS